MLNKYIYIYIYIHTYIYIYIYVFVVYVFFHYSRQRLRILSCVVVSWEPVSACVSGSILSWDHTNPPHTHKSDLSQFTKVKLHSIV